MEQLKVLYATGEKAKWYKHSGNWFGFFKKYIYFNMHQEIHFLDFYPQNENINSHKILHMNFYSGFTHSCQKLKTIQMSFN